MECYSFQPSVPVYVYILIGSYDYILIGMLLCILFVWILMGDWEGFFGSTVLMWSAETRNYLTFWFFRKIYGKPRVSILDPTFAILPIQSADYLLLNIFAGND